VSTFLLIPLLVCLSSAFALFLSFKKNKNINTFETILWPGLILLATSLIYRHIGHTDSFNNNTTGQEFAKNELKLARSEPDKIANWNALGRAYLLEQQYVESYMAYSEARQLDSNRIDVSNSDRLNWITGLAEAKILANRGAVDTDSNALIEKALSIDAGHPKALWYGGLAAAQNENFSKAQRLWQQLIAQDPPEALRNVVTQRLTSLDNVLNPEWELKFKIVLDEKLFSQKSSTSRIYASIRQAQDAPPLAANVFNPDLLDEIQILNSNHLIQGMAGTSVLDWDKPVFLSLTWSPGGVALADDNVRVVRELNRSNLSSTSTYTISP